MLPVNILIFNNSINSVAGLASTIDCKGNPNSLDEQLFTQDLARRNPKRML
jgi:hypothetical protein